MLVVLQHNLHLAIALATVRDKLDDIRRYLIFQEPIESVRDVVRSHANQDRRVQTVGCELVFVRECWS